jgi:hypothetical protein
MRRLGRLRQHLTPGVTLGAIAVVIASAGSATAASVITGRQIKNGTITSADIKNRSVSTRDLRPGAVTSSAIDPATTAALQAAVVTSRVAASQDIPGFTSAEISVDCPPGQVATGGGGRLAQNPARGVLLASTPKLGDDGMPRGWTVVLRSELSGQAASPGEAFVLCSP